MDKKTADALEKSIKHWEENVAAAKVGAEGVDITTGACALCDLFFKEITSSHIDCSGCPVQQKTRTNCCSNTPYVLVSHIRSEMASLKRNNSKLSPEAALSALTTANNKLIQACKAELTFLKSLRS